MALRKGSGRELGLWIGLFAHERYACLLASWLLSWKMVTLGKGSPSRASKALDAKHQNTENIDRVNTYVNRNTLLLGVWD